MTLIEKGIQTTHSLFFFPFFFGNVLCRVGPCFSQCDGRIEGCEEEGHSAAVDERKSFKSH